MGEPCLVSERIQDEWLRRQVIAQAEAKAPRQMAEKDAA
jgi:hypothetical protein